MVITKNIFLLWASESFPPKSWNDPPQTFWCIWLHLKLYQGDVHSLQKANPAISHFHPFLPRLEFTNSGDDWLICPSVCYSIMNDADDKRSLKIIFDVIPPPCLLQPCKTDWSKFVLINWWSEGYPEYLSFLGLPPPMPPPLSSTLTDAVVFVGCSSPTMYIEHHAAGHWKTDIFWILYFRK